MNFGAKLKELRIGKQLTQLQMAEILETSKSNISKYEAGSVEPNLETLLKISKFFNVPIDYLLDNEFAGIDYAAYTIDTPEFGLEFKCKLRSILENKNISVDSFSSMTGFHKEKVDLYLNGNKIPSIEDLIKIAGALNVSSDYLLGISSVKPIFDTNEHFYKTLTDREKNIINVYRQLNEDNQDILVGELKKCLKEQRIEESVATTLSIKEAK